MNIRKIHELCKKRGLTIAALERELGLGNGTITKWKKSCPRVDTAKKVADYFGVTVDELLKE